MIYTLTNLKYNNPGLFLPQLVPEDDPDVGKFCAGDSQAEFTKNLKTQPADWHYRTTDVSYDLNSQRYRAPEWDTINWSDAIVIFGCSVVYGIGVAENETISHYLSTIMNRPVVNVGVPGSGTLYAMQNQVMLHHSKYPAPWAVVNLWSDPYRMHEFQEVDIAQYTAHSEHAEESFEWAWGKHAVNPELHSFFAIKAAEAIWEGRSKYTSFTFWKPISDTVTELIFPDYDLARDLIHPGPIQLRTIAEKIAAKLKDK